MVLEIHNIVIHHLDKKKMEDGVFHKSHTENSIDSMWYDFIPSLLSSINKSKKIRYGVFSDENNLGLFPDNFNKYLDDSQSNSFYDLSLKTMNQLLVLANMQKFATGGYLIFINYTLDSKDYYFCVMLKNKEGAKVTFNEDTQSYELNKDFIVDIDKIHQVFRLNIQEYSLSSLSLEEKASVKDDDDEKDIHYLSFINMQSGDNEAPLYFMKTFRCIVAETPERSTNIVIKQPHDYFLAHPDLNVKKQAKAVRNRIVEYLSECSRKDEEASLSNIIDICGAALGCVKDDDKIEKYKTEILQKITTGSKSPVSSHFKVGKKALGKYLKVRIPSSDHELKFLIDALRKSQPQDEVYLNKEIGKIIITPGAELLGQITDE